MLDKTVGSVPVLYRRDDVSFEDFCSYWRDVHGVFVAQFLGPWRYRILHFAPYDPSVWASNAVDRHLEEERQLGGIAEFAFKDDEDRTYWLNTIGEFADADDAVVFRRSTSYSVSAGGYRAPKQIADPADSDSDSVRLFVMLKAKTPGAGFNAYVSDVFGPALAEMDGVLHIQTTVYDPYESPTREFQGGEGVDRNLKPDEQHQATAEIIFRDERALQNYFSNEFPSIENDFAAQIAQVHAYRVVHTYVQIQEGAMTLAGWLGGARADLVRRVNARNIIDALPAANERRLAAGLAKRRG